MTDQPTSPETANVSIWQRLIFTLDFSRQKPRVKPGAEEACFADRQGQEYFVVKAPGGSGYIKLGLQDYFLYSSFTGQKTIQQILVDYFKKFGSLAFSRIGTLFQELFAGGFLVQKPSNFYKSLAQGIRYQKPLVKILDMVKNLPQRQWPIPDFHRLTGLLYRGGFKYFFSLPAKIVSGLVILAGLVSFAVLIKGGQYSVIKSSGSYLTGLIILVLLNYLAVISHEMSHALACKHYKRKVNSGGTILYMGFPAFYVDTTDAWLLPKDQRLFISIVGPYTQAFLAGAASLLAVLMPDLFLNPLLYKFAVLSFVSVFVNFNPLLELDGYYMLVDWLELPGLKHKAAAFVKTELWRKLKFKEPLSWQEKVFTGFRLGALVWSGLALVLALYFWRLQASPLWHKFLIGTTTQARWWLLGGLALALTGGGVALRKHIKKLAAGFWQNLLKLVRQKPLVASLSLLAFFGAAALIIALFPGWVRILLMLPFGALALLAFLRVHSYYRGSHLSLVFWCLLLASLWQMALASFTSKIHPFLWLGTAGALALAGFSQFSYSSLRRWRQWQRWLWGAWWVLMMLVIAVNPGYAWPQSLGIMLLWSAFLMVLSLYWNNEGSSLEYFWMIILTGLLSQNALTIWRLPARLDLFPALMQALALLWLYLIIKGTSWQPETSAFEPADSERRRMRQAAVKIYKLSRRHFAAFFGESSAKAMDDRLNLALIEKGWPIRLYGDKSEERFQRELGILERSPAFKGLLDEMYFYISRITGAYFARNTFKTAYESLYWEEREIAQQYLMSGCQWSQGLTLKKLSQEKKDAQDVISGVARFWELSAEEAKVFFSRLKEDRRKAGETIIRQGEEGDKFYLIKSGQVEISIQKDGWPAQIAALLSRGDYFGEIALIKKVPRTATAKVLSDCSLLTLERADFELLMSQKVDLGPRIDRLIENRGFLVKLPLFSEFAPAQVAMAASRLIPRRCQPGEAVIAQSEMGDSFYIIKEGQFEVWVERDGQKNKVASLGPGEYFGEIALLLDVSRTASVISQSQGLVLQLHKDDFKSLLGEHLYFYKSLEQASSRRLKDTRHKVS
ncbi:cyclic nucleotide-binding domain-containing protein [candidate division TA06 bacterium]|uniref:Cyclic nucleotide-binding domain-containing protein n=1 Tax=candidate division TA06 bacterium TaxID=2250710 RepID=A0A933I943_UNCT6|nr:cyclic nucleotide-binding domain-containing protein [candidate division TA06 bacterium]